MTRRTIEYFKIPKYQRRIKAICKRRERELRAISSPYKALPQAYCINTETGNVERFKLPKFRL